MFEKLLKTISCSPIIFPPAFLCASIVSLHDRRSTFLFLFLFVYRVTYRGRLHRYMRARRQGYIISECLVAISFSTLHTLHIMLQVMLYFTIYYSLLYTTDYSEQYNRIDWYDIDMYSLPIGKKILSFPFFLYFLKNFNILIFELSRVHRSVNIYNRVSALPF